MKSHYTQIRGNTSASNHDNVTVLIGRCVAPIADDGVTAGSIVELALRLTFKFALSCRQVV
eukprot:2593540-Amphidinium_carterae.1